MRKASFLVLLLLLSACSNNPWSVIDGSMSKVTDAKNYDVLVSGVDGKLYFDNRRIRNVDPGFRLVRLTTTKPDRRGHHTYTSFPIFVKPCIRYYVSAQHESNLTIDNNNWDVVVLKEEPIEGCKKLLKNNPSSEQDALPRSSS